MADQEATIGGNPEVIELKEQIALMMRMMVAMQQEMASGNSSAEDKRAQSARNANEGGHNQESASKHQGASQGHTSSNKENSQHTNQHDSDDDPNYHAPKNDRSTAGRQTSKDTQRDDKGKGKEDEMWDIINERLKDVEGANCPDLKNAFELCLVPDVVLPPKFKVPEFEKYDGSTCPKSHLHMYARKMSAYHSDDKLLIHCFQDSLVGIATSWYIRLESKHIKTFLDLSNAFIRQYKFNEDSTPDHNKLQSMSKPASESFREYAQRWRGVASQVLPRLEEEEQITIFINTLPNPFFDKMIGNNTCDFNSLIRVGDRIEQNMKNGKIVAEQTGEPKRPNYMKKKETEAHYIAGEPQKTSNKINNNPRSYTHRPQHNQTPYQPSPQNTYQIPYQPIAYINHNRPPLQQNTTFQYNQPQPNLYQPRPPRPNYQPNNQAQNHNPPVQYQTQERRTFDPIPMTYAELFATLQTERILAPILGRVPNTMAAWYNPNVNCAYHSGVVGHSIETGKALKHRVQDLIDSGWLNFKDDVPTITNNPLPNHGNQGVNVLERDEADTIIDRVEDIKTPLKIIFLEMCKIGLVKCTQDGQYEGDVCMLHGTTDHNIEECSKFRSLIQELLDS
ncbi:PREDICTED: uncharacterized protein LOC109363578 [Lupinus angustifolius]|uniref:uncharacterized protein LOC109363578 n=1 Tax=Lupinus angustifolius TaxID=3871 RepID=UPI00092F36C6|nr:PREDICTED: uncharacterized protein LOC109363578 [Lupinus angustifolius]